MTSKELLYVQDALGHEKFMKTCAQDASNKLQDPNLKTYMKEFETKHNELFNRFFNLL